MIDLSTDLQRYKLYVLATNAVKPILGDTEPRMMSFAADSAHGGLHFRGRLNLQVDPSIKGDNSRIAVSAGVSP